MRKRLTWSLVFSVAVLLAAFIYQEKLSASTSFGFSAKTIAKGTIGSFEALNETMVANPNPDGDKDTDDKTLWFSLQKTIGQSDVYVQSNTWQPGGTTGWHSHPGHSIVIVTDGSLVDYESGDTQCSRHVYTKGMTFVDSGGDHIHLIRNETAYPASTVAVQTIPAGATRRIDEPAPSNCPGVL